jgi:hypothetical protein
MAYCGFLKGVFLKSFFYVFLASLAFADYRIIYNWIIGIIFAAMSVFTWVRYCADKKDDDEK